MTYLRFISAVIFVIFAVLSEAKIVCAASPQAYIIPCPGQGPEHRIQTPPGQSNLVRAIGDTTTWDFLLKPKLGDDVTIAVSKWTLVNPDYPDGIDPLDGAVAATWGSFTGGGTSTSLSWLSSPKAGTFTIKVKFKRWCGGNANANANAQEIPEEELSWNGEIKGLKIELSFNPVQNGNDPNDAMCGIDGTKEIKAHVYSEEGNQPQPDIRVQFSTSHGSITGGVNTDANGDAVATLTSKNAVGKDVGAGVATITAEIKGAEPETLTVYMISSRIIPTGDPYSFCGAPVPSFKLAVPLVIGDEIIPVSYDWSIVSGQTKVQFISDTDKSFVLCEGLSGSAPNQKDVKIQVTTSLHGHTCTETIDIAILQPSSITLVSSQAPTQIVTPTNPNDAGYGFQGQTRTYELRDQNGRPMPRVAMNEIWDQRRPSPGSTWNGPTNSNWSLSGADGRQIDYFRMNGMPPNPNIVVTLRQRLWAGSGISGQGCGPLIFPNVQYTLQGAIGF